MDGETAALIGYLHVDEGAFLFFTYDDFLKVNSKNSVELSYTLNDPYELIEEYKNCLVVVFGRLRFSQHRLRYSIHDVKSISLIGRNDMLCNKKRL